MNHVLDWRTNDGRLGLEHLVVAKETLDVLVSLSLLLKHVERVFDLAEKV